MFKNYLNIGFSVDHSWNTNCLRSDFDHCAVLLKSCSLHMNFENLDNL